MIIRCPYTDDSRYWRRYVPSGMIEPGSSAYGPMTPRLWFLFSRNVAMFPQKIDVGGGKSRTQIEKGWASLSSSWNPRALKILVVRSQVSKILYAPISPFQEFYTLKRPSSGFFPGNRRQPISLVMLLRAVLSRSKVTLLSLREG